MAIMCLPSGHFLPPRNFASPQNRTKCSYPPLPPCLSVRTIGSSSLLYFLVSIFYHTLTKTNLIHRTWDGLQRAHPMGHSQLKSFHCGLPFSASNITLTKHDDHTRTSNFLPRENSPHPKPYPILS